MNSSIIKFFIVVILGCYAPNALAKGGNLPNLEEMFNAIVLLPAQLLTLLRWASMIIGICGFVIGIFLLWYSAQQQSKNPPKFISLKNVPAVGNIVAGLVLSVCFYVVGDGLFGMAQAVQSVTGKEIDSIYSVVKYNSSLDTQTNFQNMAFALVKGVCRGLSFLSIFLAIRELKKSTLHRTENSMAKVVGFFVASGLLFDVIWTNDLIANTLKFDVLRIIF